MLHVRRWLLVALAGVLGSFGSVVAASGAVRASSTTPHFTGAPVVIGQEVCVTGYLEENYYPGAAQLAVKLVNQAGGVLGHKLELQSLDTQCIATNEITDANQLIDQFHVAAIIGGYQSAAIQGLIPTVQGDHIPFVGGGTLLQQSPWGVTIFPPNANVANTVVGFLLNKYKSIKTMGNVSGNTPFGLVVQQDVQQYANSHGIATTQAELSNTATDATPTLQQVASAAAYFTNTSGAINLIQAANAQTLGWNKPLIFDDGLISDCLAIQQKYTNGKAYCIAGPYILNHFTRQFAMEKLDKTLARDYIKSGGQANNVGVAFATYDQVNLIVNAMKAANSVTNGAKIETALSKETFQGASASFSFKPGYSFGVRGNPYDIASMTGSKMVFQYAPPAGY